MEKKQLRDLYLEAGDLLRDDLRQKVDVLDAILKSSTREDFASVGPEIIGRGELLWPDALVAALRKRRSTAYIERLKIQRIDEYIAKAKLAKQPI